MKIKYYKTLFAWLFLVSLVYLFVSIIPPLVPFGLFVGFMLVVIDGLLWLYANKLVKQGKGEEKRP